MKKTNESILYNKFEVIAYKEEILVFLHEKLKEEYKIVEVKKRVNAMGFNIWMYECYEQKKKSDLTKQLQLFNY